MGYDESAGETLGDLLVGEKPNLLIADSISTWIKKCVCSVLSTGGCGLFTDKTQIAEALNQNPDWNDFSFVLQEFENSVNFNRSEPEHFRNHYKSTDPLDTSVMNPIEKLAYFGNIIKKCFLNSK